ncbi:MAG: CDP-alcohol phosphatidyltransferase family protein [Anaerolineales bacterium]|nr:CDP-alcohol phosphatidyltransferase family protein [Anaerolineales bacterium]
MANLITLLRFPLLFIYVALLYTDNGVLQLWCVPFIVFIILMDMFDGLIARARGEVSLMGSVLDIATDRTFEIILWVVFAHLGLIPIIIPLIVITRGTTVDAVRAVGMKDGLSAFDQVKHPISRFLVSSRFMRDSYGIAKGFAFAFLTMNLGLRTLGSSWEPAVHIITLVLSWLSIAYTIARGLPVLIEGFRFIKEPPANL